MDSEYLHKHYRHKDVDEEQLELPLEESEIPTEETDDGSA